MAEERQCLAVAGANKKSDTAKTVEYFQESLQLGSQIF